MCASVILTISREAIIKIGSHAWNVYPLEAFGFLLGIEDVVYGALPASKTMRWHEFGDRWNGLVERIGSAEAVARKHGLRVVGAYAAMDPWNAGTYPIPAHVESLFDTFVIYHASCCKSCSSVSARLGRNWLERGNGLSISRGKRMHAAVNQRRILHDWIAINGSLDYSNGWNTSQNLQQLG